MVIKKGSTYECIHCGVIAFIAKVDIATDARFRAFHVKTPKYDCKPVDKIVCWSCIKPLQISNLKRWKDPE